MTKKKEATREELTREITNEIIGILTTKIPGEQWTTREEIVIAYDCIANVLVRFMLIYGITEEDILNSLDKARKILDRDSERTN